MARSIWKGAISFGLVHIPVALVSATSSTGVDFDWFDARTMDPVGYKRINKATGKEIAKENIVKGIEYEKGQYVLLSEQEIKTAHPKSTQTIEIFAFVNSSEIPLIHIDTPYYLAPDRRGEKVYALLRETLKAADKVALANVVLHTKQHLAAVMVVDSALVMVSLRWPKEVKSLASLELTKSTTHAELSKAEKDMARRLVEDMTTSWEPDEYHNTFHDKIMQLVDQKVHEGKIEQVETHVEESRKGADIIDLTELLKRSLGGGATRKKEPAAVKSKSPSTKAKTGKSSVSATSDEHKKPVKRASRK